MEMTIGDMSKAVVDRFVDDTYAVLLVGDDEEEKIVPRLDLPEKAREGAWLRVRFDGDQIVDITIDDQSTDDAKRRIQSKMARLRERGRRTSR